MSSVDKEALNQYSAIIKSLYDPLRGIRHGVLSKATPELADKVFEDYSITSDGKKTLPVSHLLRALSECGLNPPDSDYRKEIEKHQAPGLDQDQFAAVVNRFKLSQMNQIRASLCFRWLALDNESPDNTYTFAELRSKIPTDLIDDEQLRAIYDDIDRDGSGRISEAAFTDVMFKDYAELDMLGVKDIIEKLLALEKQEVEGREKNQKEQISDLSKIAYQYFSKKLIDCEVDARRNIDKSWQAGYNNLLVQSMNRPRAIVKEPEVVEKQKKTGCACCS